ncbi:unnamed protein product, partial [Allacma fusca]
EFYSFNYSPSHLLPTLGQCRTEGNYFQNLLAGPDLLINSSLL